MAKPKYHRLIVVAAEPTTEISIGDDHGHLVQKECGRMDTSLLPGSYTVEFGRGASQYDLELSADVRLTQAEVRAWPARPRRVAVRLYDESA